MKEAGGVGVAAGLLILISGVLWGQSLPVTLPAEDALLRYQQALLLEEGEGKVSDALKIYEALARDAGTPLGTRARATLRVAACRQKLGDRELAERLYKEILGTYANVRDVVDAAEQELENLKYGSELELGHALDRAGNHTDAIALYTRRLKRVPKDHQAALMRGASHYANQAFELALKDFDRALDLNDESYAAYLWRGRTHHVLGHYAEAREDLTEAIDITPSRPDAYFRRGDLFFAQRKFPQAIKDYEVARSRDSGFHRATLALGRALEGVLDYERAEVEYEWILKQRAQSPDDARLRVEALTALADLDALNADPEAARMESEDRLRWESSQALSGRLGPPPSESTLTREAARDRAELLESARSRYEEALRRRPDHVPALLGLTRLDLAEGRLDAAPAWLVEVQEALYAQRPVVLSHWDKAARAWSEESSGILPIKRYRAEAHTLAGRLELRLGNHRAARLAFRKALRLDPRHATARAGLGKAALAAKDAEAGSRHLAAARTFAASGRVDVPDPPAEDSDWDEDWESDSEESPLREGSFFHQEGLRFLRSAERSKNPELFQQARRAFARAFGENPWHVPALLGCSRAAVGWQRYDAALRLAERAVAADPTSGEAWEGLGFLLARDLPTGANPGTKRPRALRDPVRAEDAFTRAIAIGGDRVHRARHGRALALLQQVTGPADERLAGADADLAAAFLAATPQELARATPARIQDYLETIDLVVRVRERLQDPDALAAALAQRERFVAEAYRIALGELEAGRTLRDRLNYSEAIRHFDRAIALAPKLSAAIYDRGTCYLKIGNFVPGILDFSRALELDPRIAEQVYTKVYQISYVVDLNRVITELNKIVSDHPDVSYVVFLRGFFYVAKTEFKKVGREDLELGIADFDRTLELNPNHVTAFLYRGFMHYKVGRIEQDPAARVAAYERAMSNWEQALELDPISAISHHMQALLWSVRSQEEGLDEAEVERRQQLSLAELKAAFETGYDGYERIKNNKGFDAIREREEFKELMKEK